MFSFTLEKKWNIFYSNISKGNTFFTVKNGYKSSTNPKCAFSSSDTLRSSRYSGMLEVESSLILSIFSDIYDFFFLFFFVVPILPLRITLIFNFYIGKTYSVICVVLSACSSDILLFSRIKSKCNAFFFINTVG